jgi:hypothetical protein
MLAVTTSATYDERLHVPLRWWVQGVMLVASLWLAMIVALPVLLAWVLSAVALACLAGLLLGYGSARIRVADGQLFAARSRIEATYLGAAEALDPGETVRVRGVDADARAWLLLRPYLKRSVRVLINDPDDPAPYWLLSTRHPAELSAALTALVADAQTGR